MSMEENINISEKIDRYVLGQMGLEEKAIFEAELSADPELRHEYEMQREIILAAQRVHFRHHLKDIEQQVRLRRKTTIKTVTSWSIAAAIVCVCVLGLDMKYSSDLRDTSMLCYAETGAPLTRSDNEIDNLLSEAYELIGKNELESALSMILSAEKIIKETPLYDAISEEAKYQYEIRLLQEQDLEWYKALILMKEGEIFKSRKVLKQIASSNSRYANAARTILERSFPL